MTDAEFLMYLDPEHKEYHQHDQYQDALQGIVSHSPTLMQDVIELFELGNEAGSASVRELLEENLETIVFQVTRGDSVATTRIDGLEYATNSFKEALAAHWAVGALSSETEGNSFYSINSGVRETVRLHKLLRSKDSSRDYGTDLSYWKAIGATALIVDDKTLDGEFADEQIEEWRGIVQWLEPKEYLGDVIRVARERGLKDPESINAILESDAPTSLSSGVL